MLLEYKCNCHNKVLKFYKNLLIYGIDTLSNHVGEPLGEVFTKLEKMDDNSTQYQAFVCLRHNHCPMLHIRGAR